MNTQLRQVLQHAARLVVFCFVLCGISTIEIFTQKTAKAAPKAKEVWYLTYEVTIKGSGSSKDYNGAGDEASWEVDRSYSGAVELGSPSPLVDRNMSQREMIASLQLGGIVSWRHVGTYSKAFDGMTDVNKRASIFLDGMTLPINIKINDQINTHSELEGEGRSFENFKNTTYWKGNSSATKTQNSMELVIDKTRSTYNVTIPLTLVADDPGLPVTSSTLVTRSKYGWGDKPEKELITGPPKMVGFDTVKIPGIKGLLEGGTIHHPANLPLTMKDGSYEFDSGEIEVKEPLFGARDSFGGVTIRVFYLFKKMPAK